MGSTFIMNTQKERSKLIRKDNKQIDKDTFKDETHEFQKEVQKNFDIMKLKNGLKIAKEKYQKISQETKKLIKSRTRKQKKRSKYRKQ